MHTDTRDETGTHDGTDTHEETGIRGENDIRGETGTYVEPVERRRPWLIYALIAAGLVLAALIGRYFASAGAAKNAHAGRPVAAVAVAKVVPADVPVTVSAIGTVTPIDTATVRTQLAGNLFAILFREGQQVHAGQVIAQIDPR
ncbi:MAG: biotin/lipoyl-binding protein, partial [Pseudomonadota bacterium]|nr:biotin/lipoyl-binding protein [Pseudomonadota bacterium]